MGYSKELWESFGSIPIDDDGFIQEQFLDFPIATQREDIWHWFEERYNVSVYTLMFG